MCRFCGRRFDLGFQTADDSVNPWTSIYSKRPKSMAPSSLEDLHNSERLKL